MKMRGERAAHLVRAHDSYHANIGMKRCQTCCNVPCASKSKLFILKVKHRHRRLWTQAFGITVEVPIHHEIPDEHHPSAGQVFDEVDQARGHATILRVLEGK